MMRWTIMRVDAMTFETPLKSTASSFMFIKVASMRACGLADSPIAGLFRPPCTLRFHRIRRSHGSLDSREAAVRVH